jgi:hypothetical protein
MISIAEEDEGDSKAEFEVWSKPSDPTKAIILEESHQVRPCILVLAFSTLAGVINQSCRSSRSGKILPHSVWFRCGELTTVTPPTK